MQGFKYIETISVRKVNIKYNAIVVVKSDAFSSRTKSLGRIIEYSGQTRPVIPDESRPLSNERWEGKNSFFLY